MSTNTTNYNLTKQDKTEFYDVHIVNENLDKIDLAIKEAKDAAENVDLSQIEQSIEAVADEVTQHLAQNIVSELGAHNARYFEGKLQFKVNGAWVDFKSGTQIPVASVKNFTANGSNKKITLRWEDPTDLVVDNVTIAKWKGTKILRKLGGYPQNENDGVLVVDSGVRNQYKNNGFIDSNLTNDVMYYYSAFPYTSDDIYKEKTDVSAAPIPYRVYGVEINISNYTVTRIGDATGLSRSDFDNKYPWNGIRRCNLSNNISVNAYYGEANYSVTGSNGQVMVEIPKFYHKWSKPNSNLIRIEIADGPEDGFSVHPAFYRDRNNDKVAEEVDKRYIGAYLAYKNGNQLESRSGVSPTMNLPFGEFDIAAKLRGNGWGLSDYYLMFAIQMLYLIEYADLNSQTAIGMGNVLSPGAAVTTGATNAYGNNSFGTTSEQTKMSYRGIEDLYGTLMYWIDGIWGHPPTSINGISNIAISLTSLSNTDQKEFFDSGINSVGIQGYFGSIHGNEKLGFLWNGFKTGTSSIGFCDYVFYNSTSSVGITNGTFGGFVNTVNTTHAGVFRLELSSYYNNSNDKIGGRIAC